MQSVFMTLKNRYIVFKNDKTLVLITLLHLFLAACHIYHSFISPTHYHIYLRAAGCLIIAFMSFFWGRNGLGFGMMIFACALIHINTFYNYGGIFFILVAIGANPKLKKPAIILYLVNMVISFSHQKLLVFSASIHVIYIFLFYLLMNYLFKIHKPDALNLTEDEKKILDELAKGKLQKEIELYSQQTISQKLKNARERNMTETTAELVEKYKKTL